MIVAGKMPGLGVRQMAERLKRRRDFLSTAKGYKAVRNGFVLEARPQDADPSCGYLGQARVGLTITRRVAAKAVERNRIRRRLRELARLADSQLLPGFDYVLVGRRAALSEDFAKLGATLASALRQVHRHRVEPMKERAQAPHS